MNHNPIPLSGETRMNRRPSISSHARIPARTRLQAVAAILLLQANLAFAVEPPQSQSAPANPQSTQPAPEPPAPAANGTATPTPTLAQAIQQTQQPAFAPQRPFHVQLPRSHNPLAPYRPSTAPELDLSNSPRLQSLIRDGKIYISLRDAIAIAIENNLDLAYFRYNFPIAQTDILRTKSGAQANGVNAVVTQSTQGGFSSSGAGGGSSGGSAAAGAGGIVTSTLGAGTSVSSFDPYLTFQGFVDHTTTPEPNAFQIGTPLFKTNTIEVLTNYSQSFPIGTNVSVS